MAVRADVISVDLGKELLAIVDQRVKQEGVNRSEYIREAIILELVMSGDVEAMKYVGKRVGKRMKSAILERFVGVDLKECSALLTE